MNGHLHLTASVDHAGRTYVSKQSFRAPLHLSKPHLDEEALVVNVVNPTAGLFDGDEVDVQISVEPGARLVLTTPSAGRVYRARSDRPASVCQEIRVASGGYAEFFPELFIPQAGARYHQQTQLRVEPGGQMLYCEWLAPGRVARGEVFDYRELLWDTDLWHGTTLAARERYRLTPGDESLTALKTVFPESHYLGFFVSGWPVWPEAALDALTEPGSVYAGHGVLAGGGGVVKALCADNLSARRTFGRVRSIFHEALGRPVPSLRRF
jgi:urease accessory protein